MTPRPVRKLVGRFQRFSSETTGRIGAKLGHNSPWVAHLKVVSDRSAPHPRWPPAGNIVQRSSPLPIGTKHRHNSHWVVPFKNCPSKIAASWEHCLTLDPMGKCI